MPALVIAVAVVLFLSYLNTPLYISIPVLLAAPWWLGPIIVKLTQRQPAKATLIPVRNDEDPRALATLEELSAELQALGFKEAARLKRSSDTGNSRALMVLASNEQTGDVGIGMVAMRMKPEPKVMHSYVGFSTSLRDGQYVRTSNSPVSPAMPPNPRSNGLRHEAMKDAGALYAFHRGRIGKFTKRPPSAGDPFNGNAVTYQQRVEEEEILWMQQIGYWAETPDDRLAPTLKGACLMCWRLLPPWKEQIKARAAAEATAEEERQRRSGGSAPAYPSPESARQSAAQA